MPNQANLLIPRQELDVLKIMKKLGLAPERLLEYMVANGFEEHENNSGQPSSDMLISYQAANEPFIAVSQGAPSLPALTLAVNPNKQKPCNAALNKQSLHYAASMG